MSKVTIQGDASGTGIFTIASPNSNTDRTLVLPDEAGTVLTSAGVPASAMPAGSVIQVVQVVKTDTFSIVSTTMTDVTGLNVSITPSSTNSKILVIADVAMGPTASEAALGRLVRDTTPIYLGDAAGVRARSIIQAYPSNDYATVKSGGVFLDSPATTLEVTYKFQLASTAGGASYINRTAADRNTSGYDARSASSITLMEIVG